MPLWTSLLQFGADGTIELLLPRPGHPTYRPGGVCLHPGESLRLAADYYARDPRHRAEVSAGLPLRLPDGFPRKAESVGSTATLFLKLMAATRPVDFECLVVPRPTRGEASAPSAALGDWTSCLLSVTVHRAKVDAW